MIPFSVAFPEMGPYDAVITATLSYRTSADTRATVSASLAEQGESTPLELSSGARRVPAASRWSSLSLSWLASDLTGATTYDLMVGVHPVSKPNGTYFAESRDVLVTVEAAPSDVA